MSPTTQALLFALLGAVLGGGVVFAFRISEQQMRSGPSRVPGNAELADGVSGVLSLLRSSALVIGPDDHVINASAPATAMGLVRDGALVVPEVSDVVAQVRRDGQIRETETTIRRATGTPPRTISARVAPLSSTHMLVLVEDRTRERQVESIRRDFVVNVSHELKTPVGAIKLLSDAVIAAADDPEAVQRFAKRMHAESDRLARLVQQIIELSRLQGDDPLERPRGVAVDEILERAVAENATDAEARRITMVRGDEEGLMVLGNKEQIALAVNNLVSNAIRYSPEGSTVAIGAQGADTIVEITVTDQGVGIPVAEIERIFERFYRVDPARHRSTGGTGLGLSIVKHVAAIHGGEVRASSVEGQGSTFTLTLPRRRTSHRTPADREEPS